MWSMDHRHLVLQWHVSDITMEPSRTRRSPRVIEATASAMWGRTQAVSAFSVLLSLKRTPWSPTPLISPQAFIFNRLVAAKALTKWNPFLWYGTCPCVCLCLNVQVQASETAMYSKCVRTRALACTHIWPKDGHLWLMAAVNWIEDARETMTQLRRGVFHTVNRRE